MLLFHLALALSREPPAVCSNVVLIVADGLRREEVFGGADAALLASCDGTVRAAYGHGNATERRRRLMPFLWGTLVENGQILGDQSLGSVCQVTNRYLFSYPGYSEMICGYADDKVCRNDSIPNPNVSVFEWLNRLPAFNGRVAAFGAWGVISAVFNKQRCGFTDVAGYEPLVCPNETSALDATDRAKLSASRLWPNEAPDALTFRTALEYTKADRPRILFLSLGETDKWAHQNRYDRYLDAAHRFDADVAELWRTLQSMPQYRDDTTLILTCDHGRGAGSNWTSHGRKLPNSRFTWMAFLGPGTSPLGDVPATKATNSQIAATVAAAVGYEYGWAQVKAAAPLISALR